MITQAQAIDVRRLEPFYFSPGVLKPAPGRWGEIKIAVVYNVAVAGCVVD